MSSRRLAFAVCAAALLSAPLAARAQVRPAASLAPLAAAPPDTAAPAATEYRFEGLALYAGAGAGMIADLGEPSFNTNFFLTVPVASWAAIEGASSLTHFAATSHHGDSEQTNGLGIGVGLRLTPFEVGAMRPYLAARFAHLHFWPDPWGEHTDNGNGTYDHASMHRWGGALGAGVDAPLFASSPRFRVGLDLEAMALSGPTANAILHATVTLGVGF